MRWVFRANGEVGSKSSCPPSKVCFPLHFEGGNLGVPENLPGCPRPMGGAQKVRAEKVRARFSFPISELFQKTRPTTVFPSISFRPTVEMVLGSGHVCSDWNGVWGRECNGAEISEGGQGIQVNEGLGKEFFRKAFIQGEPQLLSAQAETDCLAQDVALGARD